MEKMDFIDVHGHINFAAYDTDREEVIGRAQAKNVGMIAVGTDETTSLSAIKVAESYSNIWATVGMHPTFAGESRNDPLETGVAEGVRPKQDFHMEKFEKLAAHPKVVAIGECGLDYFHSKAEDMNAQREVFRMHIEVANKVNKPLMLHVRNSEDAETSAYQEAVVMLKKYSKVRSNFHFFAGTLEDLKAILEIGAKVSFTGVITFAKNYSELIKAVPLESMLSETDCPYVAPKPYRGKRNEPLYVIEVVKAIAEIKGIDGSIVGKQLLSNAKTFFGI